MRLSILSLSKDEMFLLLEDDLISPKEENPSSSFDPSVNSGHTELMIDTLSRVTSPDSKDTHTSSAQKASYLFSV
jgi:hypothetical protein